MRLKELEIQGFKSFPDKTKIEIGEGITGVVGPNGSGKSNISDSIRWVLGETSSKQLRGSGKMEDVIFGGTQSRGAMGYASVALTIDNSDHGLDMDADEVTIGRRYYRSGESEYSINGQNVRLKDVYELLLDTGIGRDGYASVGQGRIAEIVGAKSAERREIFEEASGIAKYRYRKNEAERRLDAAEGNLERLRDILGELEKRVGPLKRDSEKAQQFLELSEKRKTLEITLWVDAIRRANDSLRDQQRKYEAAPADYDRLSRQLDEFDEKSASLRAEAQQLMLAVEQANADIRAITEANAGSESEIAVLKNESEHSRFRIDDATSELERAGQGRESIEREAADHRAASETLKSGMAGLDARVAELREALRALEEKAAASGERRDVIDAAMARLQDTATAARVSAASAQSAGEAAANRLAEALREKGEEPVAMDLARCDMAEAVAQAFRFSKLVLATPTYNADVFPFMKEFIHHLTERNYQNRSVAFIENGSCAPMAAKVMTKMLEGSKNLTYAATTVTVRGALNAASAAQHAALAAAGRCALGRAENADNGDFV